MHCVIPNKATWSALNNVVKVKSCADHLGGHETTTLIIPISGCYYLELHNLNNILLMSSVFINKSLIGCLKFIEYE